MARRPRIGADVIRALLIESGHRCAVCGAGCPLEKAHIIPWHKSKEHKLDDLICLCASCHARADSERWGEKALREYKKRPWILRQGSESQKVSSPVLVQVTIDLDRDQFDETYQRLIQYAIAAFLNLPPDAVSITSVKPSNSLDITVRLGSEQAKVLLESYHERDRTLMEYLAPFRLLNIKPLTEQAQFSRKVVNVSPKRKRRKLRRIRDYFISINEAAQILNVSQVTVRRWARTGMILAVKKGPGGHWYIRSDHLEAFTTVRNAKRKKRSAHK